MSETAALFDSSALHEPSRKRESNRRKRRETLRAADWYAGRLETLGFHAYDIRSDLPLEEILNAYADKLEGNPLAYLDRHILKLELSRLAHEKNHWLSGQMATCYPGPRSYTHQRRCPHNDPKYIGLDRLAPLKYEKEHPAKIIHSVGQSALFHKPSEQFKIEMLRLHDMSEDCDLDGLSSYDFMPNQFLIARIWAIRSLGVHLEWQPPPFETTVQLFEERLRQARRRLKHPKPFRSDTCHIALHSREMTGYVPKETEEQLLAFDNLFRARPAA